jgi:RimJ/RimL family protein N-acetyltransferase
MTDVRPLRAADAAACLALRRRALRDAPMAFLSSPEDDLVRTVAAMRQSLERAPEQVVFGAFASDGASPALVGMVGLHRDRHRKAAHKVHLWGMYVAPEGRGQGVATALLAAAIAHARTLPGVAWVHLSVSDTAAAARRLYARAGFHCWGSEPDALRHAGRRGVEHHLALALE